MIKNIGRKIFRSLLKVSPELTKFVLRLPLPSGILQTISYFAPFRNQNLMATCRIKNKRLNIDLKLCLDVTGKPERGYLQVSDSDPIPLLLSILSHEQLFIDIGANVGYYTNIAASYGVKVIAFEPEIMNYAKLILNSKINNHANLITVENCAISDVSGKAKLRPVGTNRGMYTIRQMAESANPENASEITTYTLDDYLRIHSVKVPIGLVKIDVEGHEESVFNGMANTLSNNPPKYIVFESYTGPNAIMQKLEPYGYCSVLRVDGKQSSVVLPDSGPDYVLTRPEAC